MIWIAVATPFAILLLIAGVGLLEMTFIERAKRAEDKSLVKAAAAEDQEVSSILKRYASEAYRIRVGSVSTDPRIASISEQLFGGSAPPNYQGMPKINKAR